MPHYIFESRVLSKIGGPVAGVDEAGRGPLAGPVVAAAVVFERRRIPKGLDDSKAMTPAAREEAYAAIMEKALAVGVGEASVDEIDLVNIRQATHFAMARAIRALGLMPAFALVDGSDPPALPCPCDAIVGGDGRSASIAAASIVAKVTRDRMMVALHECFPGYGWLTNKGYGTEEHLAALDRLGPTLHHRRSFMPVHNILYGNKSQDSSLRL